MKTSIDNMLNEISEDLNQFLKNGNLTSFTKEIDPNLKIDNILKLLRIHFILTATKKNKVGVINFIEQLPQRLRRIKTTVRKESEIIEGEVKGRINWQGTIRLRYNRNPSNKALFVCDKKEKNYDIAENLVLKRLLQIVHNIIYNDLNPAFKERYSWLKDWVGRKELKNVLNQLFLRNVYLKRIDLTENIVTERMINRAAKSRTILYREAAELLTRYNKLMKYDLDASEAKELLRNTFIEPDKAETLFELYWTIKIIKQFIDPKYQLIEPGSDTVATWKTKKNKYKIYHNSVGNFEFKEKVDALSKLLKEKDNYLGRALKVFDRLEKLVGVKSGSLWGGRPDILLEKYDENDNLDSILVGEVKYTQDKGYAIQGLRELLEYLALIKSDGIYIEKYDDLFSEPKKIKGALFLDFMGEDKLDIENDESVFVAMFGDNCLYSQLKKWDDKDI
ncbi:hypothetical protein ACFLZT_00505 [Thermodesulfobacteriota bacterium]